MTHNTSPGLTVTVETTWAPCGASVPEPKPACAPRASIVTLVTPAGTVKLNGCEPSVVEPFPTFGGNDVCVALQDGACARAGCDWIDRHVASATATTPRRFLRDCSSR